MYSTGTYACGDFANMLMSFQRDGYVLDYGDELEVVQSAPAAMTVTLGSGRAWIQGYWYQNSEDKALTIAAADAIHPRIDRVVLRLTATVAPRKIVAAVLTGVAGASPAAPDLTQEAATWEISLAQIAVAAAETQILTADITDERNDYTLCGVAGQAGATFAELITTADVDMDGKKITNLPAPSADTDIARKAYYDTVTGGVLGVNKCEITPCYGAVPAGWLECNGASLLRASYPDLFSSFGTTFGSADGTHFTLPDLRGRMVYGATATIGTTSGAITVTLAEATTPAHTHSGCHPGTALSPGAFTSYGSGSEWYGGESTTDYAATAGSGTAHANLSPYMVLRFIVRAS
jgi:microcystin-dependent protein